MPRGEEAAHSHGIEEVHGRAPAIGRRHRQGARFLTASRDASFVTGEALAVAGQVEGCAALPVGPEDCRDASSEATWPEIKRQDPIGPHVPRAAGRRLLGVTGAVQTQLIFPPVLRGDTDEGERPRDRNERQRPSA